MLADVGVVVSLSYCEPQATRSCPRLQGAGRPTSDFLIPKSNNPTNEISMESMILWSRGGDPTKVASAYFLS